MKNKNYNTEVTASDYNKGRPVPVLPVPPRRVIDRKYDEYVKEQIVKIIHSGAHVPEGYTYMCEDGYLWGKNRDKDVIGGPARFGGESVEDTTSKIFFRTAGTIWIINTFFALLHLYVAYKILQWFFNAMLGR